MECRKVQTSVSVSLRFKCFSHIYLRHYSKKGGPDMDTTYWAAIILRMGGFNNLTMG
ncbi:hypothetical protein HYC85_004461 [Camellia sinensis]|uniref:Uncharacterized protein n=1 Tax=Camellia sinensis TaxID=4442 RepID=A0A7J7HYM7_CAMSI|nr:hypothetical protein HYC85_004461 [Camellia sinensis]